MTTEEQFLEWKTQGYNWIPVIYELLGDLETPLTVYLKLANSPLTYLLESGFNGERWGRYSFIGLTAKSTLSVKRSKLTTFNGSERRTYEATNPLDEIEKIIAQYKAPVLEDYPRFMGGFVGYFGYDTIRYIEPKLQHFKEKDPLDLPDIFLMLSEELAIYDNLSNKIYLVIYKSSNEPNAYQAAVQRLLALKQKLKSAHVQLESPQNTSMKDFVSNISKDAYESGVKQAIEYFKAGDAMQLILSQRFSKTFKSSPLALYRTLRQLNPSPYMFYLNLNDFFIVGASPEILVRLEQGRVTVRPLAGTRRRGKTVEEDDYLESDLLSDAKEIAEHLMLIDLGRNDIGRICEVGTVQVVEQMVIERFSHVMHISSTVSGKVKADISPLDVLRATFPAGTVSGAPKIRAMEIIDLLEEESRGVYGGAVGYIGWNRNLDMAIALRSAIIKDNTIFIQAGAGLVADSKPENEWQECINKAKALFLATEQTENNTVE